MFSPCQSTLNSADFSVGTGDAWGGRDGCDSCDGCFSVPNQVSQPSQVSRKRYVSFATGYIQGRYADLHGDFCAYTECRNPFVNGLRLRSNALSRKWG